MPISHEYLVEKAVFSVLIKRKKKKILMEIVRNYFFVVRKNKS